MLPEGFSSYEDFCDEITDERKDLESEEAYNLGYRNAISAYPTSNPFSYFDERYKVYRIGFDTATQDQI